MILDLMAIFASKCKCLFFSPFIVSVDKVNDYYKITTLSSKNYDIKLKAIKMVAIKRITNPDRKIKSAVFSKR